jgi:hypothetical protein
MTTGQRHSEHTRRFLERWGDPKRRELMRPVVLGKIDQHEDANRLLFEGLMKHYAECVATGRLDVWAKAAHAAIDLIACDRLPFVRRRDLP